MTLQASDKKPVHHDIFEDPAIARAADEDPVVLFLAQNWRRVLVALLAIPAITYAVNTYRGTQEAKKAQASQLLASVRSSYEQVDEIQTQIASTNKEVSALKVEEKEKKADLDKRIADLTEKLTGTRARLDKQIQSLSDVELAPFPTFASLYRGLLAARENRIADAKTILGPIQWKGINDSAERFVGEMAALSLARALLDDPNSIKDGRRLLEELGAEGQYSRVSAILALSAVAETDAEKSKAVALAEKVIAEQPEQSKFLSDDIARLK